MRYSQRIIKSIPNLVNSLKQQCEAGEIVWFRGQGRKDWKLVPSLARDPNHLRAESAIIKRFIQNAVPHMDQFPTEEWQWMFTMQHHRAPTRLLDWSESPLAALFFAVDDEPRHDGAVWCLDPLALNNSAGVSFEFTSEIPSFGIDSTTENYLPSRVEGSTSNMSPIAVIGPRNTPRMAAQLGTFTINHKQHTPIEEISDKKHIWRWLIPKEQKASIKEELSLLAFNRLTLFPELDNVAAISRELIQ